jgi:hypothetical protein
MASQHRVENGSLRLILDKANLTQNNGTGK